MPRELPHNPKPVYGVDTSKFVNPTGPLHFAEDLYNDPESLREATMKPVDPEAKTVYEDPSLYPKPPELARALRREVYDELYRMVDPEELAAGPEVPGHIQEWFDEVFAIPLEHGANIKLCWHPHWNRWCLAQELAPGQWEIFWVCHEAIPNEDYLPPDLAEEGKKHEHMRGKIGDFRLPQKWEFEVIVGFWLKANTPEEIEEKLNAPERAKEYEIERQLQDRERDALDYYHWYVWRAANHGRRGYSVPTVEYRPEGERWRYEQREGFRIRVRRGTTAEMKLDEMLEREERARNHVETLVRADRLIEEDERRKEREERRRLMAGREKQKGRQL